MRLLLAAVVVLAAPVAAQQAAPTPESVVQRFVDAANARDARAMAALVAPDAVFARFPSGTTMTVGRDSIEARYRRSLASAPAGFRITIHRRIVEGEYVIDQERFPALADGRAESTWMYQVRGGLITRAWVLESAAQGSRGP